MYPIVRMMWQNFLHRKSPPLPLTGVHVSHHYCLPWDIDLWCELNNGCTLTLYDLGRIPMFRRVGLLGLIERKGCGVTAAGVSVRYRRRVRMFDHLEMRSRIIGRDARFFYLEQSMWNRQGDCTSHCLYRIAVTGQSGIVPTAEVIAAFGHEGAPSPLPDWVRAWIAAEETRPWPPMQE